MFPKIYTPCRTAAVLVWLTCNGAALAERADHVLKIWPGDPPGEAMADSEEQDFTKDTDPLIAGKRIIKLGNVSSPEAHVFLPPTNLHTGAAVVIAPGGGFSILAWDLEGTEVAQWLNTIGIAGIVLKYRVPTRERSPRWLAATQDTQRAVSLTRHHAGNWGIDRDKVAVLGFSAGGMAAFNASTATSRYYEVVDKADQQSCRPNRSILIYAAGLPESRSTQSPAKKTTAPQAEQKSTQLISEISSQTPPMFLVHTFDDFVPVSGTAHVLLAMKRAKVPCELHVFDSGGHGYGLRKTADHPVTTWPLACEAWLRRARWLDPGN